MTHYPNLFCAIDTNDLDHAKTLCQQLSHTQIGFKFGLEFFNAFGAQTIADIQQQYPDNPIFLDLKYHDIPNTVAGAIKAVTSIFQPAYLNVHSAGGLDMMQAAKEACPDQTKLLAVTILTSLNQDSINAVGYQNSVPDQVKQMALLTQKSGLDGVVCSSHEIKLLRRACGDDFALMVPGIRPAGSNAGDQKRIMTPEQAINLGATHLVIGRPITQSDDPAQTVQDILASLNG